MEKLFNDFSFSTSLFFLQLFMIIVLFVSIWALIILAKDQRESLGVKLFVFVSFLLIPLLSAIFYLIHYYTKRQKHA